LLELYVRFHNEAEKNASLDEEARAEYKRFEEGDPEARKTWQKIVGWTWNEIRPLYERLGVSFDAVHGESFFEERMKGVLEKGRQKGVFVDGENGAWIVLPEDPNDPPALVRKSDGTSLYLTRDLAQMEFFEQEYHPDAMLWPVDSAQKLHFRQRFAAARKLGITNARLVHAEFGRMNFKDGGMSTRKGNIVRMEAVLDEAEKRSLELIRSKGAELTEEEQKALAVQMGANAVKYNILSQNRLSDITFDWNTMLAMEGNSAPYLMYTVARARSVLRKAGMEAEKTARFELTMTDDHETRLMLTLMGYAEAVRRSAEEFKPNHIANHLYQLAQDFNSFYNALPILKAEKLQRESRLLLTAATLNVMEDAFGLLVMAPPDKM
jgi:arginyl-tRNA synthetase